MRAGAYGAPAAHLCGSQMSGATGGANIDHTVLIFHTDGNCEYGKNIYDRCFQRSASGGLAEKLATAFSKMAANSSSDNNSAARSLYCPGAAGSFEEMFRACQSN